MPRKKLLINVCKPNIRILAMGKINAKTNNDALNSYSEEFESFSSSSTERSKMSIMKKSPQSYLSFKKENESSDYEFFPNDEICFSDLECHLQTKNLQIMGNSDKEAERLVGLQNMMKKFSKPPKECVKIDEKANLQMTSGAKLKSKLKKSASETNICETINIQRFQTDDDMFRQNYAIALVVVDHVINKAERKANLKICPKAMKNSQQQFKQSMKSEIKDKMAIAIENIMSQDFTEEEEVNAMDDDFFLSLQEETYLNKKIPQSPKQVMRFNTPTIGEFSINLGAQRIYDYITSHWEFHSNWAFCINLIDIRKNECSHFFIYDVQWSLPTKERPVPPYAVSVYFIYQVSKYLPRSFRVTVTFSLEGSSLQHFVDEVSTFEETRLFGLLKIKSQLMRRINF